ncbi:rod shape-determining protein MreD [Acetobacter nitrogenifigens DSM 23921 = NBRC 105050]|uniref:Rod shape-determining protein MreD n=1 Tax=Acetobacter nitrogenifigens DSM 23921 = NBRC 105050 TaxID=1120919 RepID=A0A511X8K1_9PROT|nr:hypothetical protein [Acetobacter nitrogenifigens]GBQ91920.1 rod shape-determining protein MreD [Acetobacter nitrogenifigens DSM 23921 = NBRC 105050]GEN59273.1 hypothetical protein ANI02nite_11570 [Acetobacter nitrogenifigens DSM 23921 = NBRC 105050]
MASDPPQQRQQGLRARPSLALRLDRFAARMAPGGVTALLIALLSAPTGLPGATALLPGVVMSLVFFWSVWRPDAMPAPMVLLLGLFMDLIGFAPPGVNAFVLLLLHGVAAHLRFGLMRLSFLVIWLVFAVLAALACGLDWLLVSTLSLQPMPSAPAIFETMLAVGVYPPLSALSSRAHRLLSHPDPHA